jgi:hypothetical protein
LHDLRVRVQEEDERCVGFPRGTVVRSGEPSVLGSDHAHGRKQPLDQVGGSVRRFGVDDDHLRLQVAGMCVDGRDAVLEPPSTVMGDDHDCQFGHQIGVAARIAGSY